MCEWVCTEPHGCSVGLLGTGRSSPVSANECAHNHSGCGVRLPGTGSTSPVSVNECAHNHMVVVLDYLALVGLAQ